MPNLSGLDLGIAASLAPMIRALVQYVKPAWSNVDQRLSGVINLIVSLLLGILISFAWTGYLQPGQGIAFILGLGILSGGLSVVYNDARSLLLEDKQQGSGGAGVMQIVDAIKNQKVLSKVSAAKKQPSPKVGSVTPQQ